MALLEAGQPLCVLPGWSDMDRGMPGYTRDALGRSPFAFALDDEIEDLGRASCRRRRTGTGGVAPARGRASSRPSSATCWRGSAAGGYYWHDVGRQGRPRRTRPRNPSSASPSGPRAATASTACSARRDELPADAHRRAVRGHVGDHARIELAVATTQPSQRAGSVFPWLAQYPWQAVTSFASGDNVKWYHQARTFPLGPRWEGVLLLDDPSRLDGPDAPDMSGFSFGGDRVQWLWLVPITEEERQFGKDKATRTP